MNVMLQGGSMLALFGMVCNLIGIFIGFSEFHSWPIGATVIIISNLLFFIIAIIILTGG